MFAVVGVPTVAGSIARYVAALDEQVETPTQTGLYRRTAWLVEKVLALK